MVELTLIERAALRRLRHAIKEGRHPTLGHAMGTLEISGSVVLEARDALDKILAETPDAR